jgi:hypothetical protein
MPPKTPNELKEQLEQQNAGEPPAEGVERSAEGIELPIPKRGEVLGNLAKIARVEKE